MGLYSGGIIYRKDICSEILGGLFSGGLIFGGAYYRNFTVFTLDPWSTHLVKHCYRPDQQQNTAEHRQEDHPPGGFLLLCFSLRRFGCGYDLQREKRRNSYLKQNSCGAGMSYFTSVCLQKQPVAMGPWNLNKQLWSVYKLINSMMRV